MRELKSIIGAMPKRVVPAHLSTKLRIAASHEIARRRQRVGLWKESRNRMQLFFNNLMRPFALPAAGGIVSAILLLGAVTPYLEGRSETQSRFDVPTALYTEASVYKTGPVGFEGAELDLLLTIDERGRMIDYEATDPHCRKLLKDPEIRRSLENHLILTEFTPATSFGQPTNAKIRLTLRTSRIDVKG